MNLRRLAIAFFVASVSAVSLFAAPPTGFRQGPAIRFRAAEELSAARGASGAALSLASADFDADGIADLVVGYAAGSGGVVAFHRGNLDAFAPQSDAAFREMQAGMRRPPFIGDAPLVELPIRPDFLAAANVIGDDHIDLIAAARNDNSVYVFPGDGTGQFGAPVAVQVSGGVTSLAAGDFGGLHDYRAILVGVGGSVDILRGRELEVRSEAVLPLKSGVEDIQLADLDGDSVVDAAVLAGGSVFVIHGADARVEDLSLPKPVAAIAVGAFIFDRRPGQEIAALTTDGDLQFLVRANIDPRRYTVDEARQLRAAAREGRRLSLAALTTGARADGWKIAETLSGVARYTNQSVPVILRTRLSGRAQDDVTILNPSAGQMATISRPNGQVGNAAIPPAEITLRPYAGQATRAISQRVNVDVLPGLVVLEAGKSRPQIIAPLATTITVNDTTDTLHTTGCAATGTGTCSVRDAVVYNNNVSAGTTIDIPAGTYTLSIPRTGVYDGTAGGLYINNNVTIVGAGQNTTIIQAGTNNTNGVDLVMAVNEDLGPLTDASASISNLTLRFGHNNGAHGFDGDGGCMEFDTGQAGNSTLTLTNVTLTDCSTTAGNGAGIALFDATNSSGSGNSSFSGCIIQNNTALDTSGSSTLTHGGGIWISSQAQTTLTNCQILNNKAVQVQSGNAQGFGGGIFSFDNTSPTPLSQIHNTVISGNESSSDGGGVYIAQAMQIDQGSTITGNIAGRDASNNPVAGANGGGIWVNTGSPDAVTLSKITIANNTATGNGGGIFAGNGGNGSLTISFCRLAGNTATLGSNLRNNNFSVTATNNWWGTNNPSSTISQNGGTTSFDPFIVLTHSASPEKIRINQSTTLTGDMTQDNHGNSAALSGNLGVIAGLPITFNGATLGTIPESQPETLGNPVPKTTATFNAGGTSGRGSANATVDQAVVAVDSNLIASATEAGTTATITTTGVHNHAIGDVVVISGVTDSGYNGTYTITSVPSSTSFTYVANTPGLSPSSGGTATTGIVILAPPQITKSFGAASIPINGTATTTFSINNPNVVAINASFTDTLPAGLAVAATPTVTNTCGGSVGATPGSGQITFSNSALPAGVCTITLNITGTADNNYLNSVTIDSTDAGNGNTSSANITVINPPHIVKAFGAATIPVNGTASLTFTVDSNSNQNLSLTGVGFTDSLPAGLVVATPSGLSTTCGGTATATAGSSAVSLSGATVAPNSTCTVSLNVQGITTGAKNNSVQVTSTNAGTGNTSSASITVMTPPTIAKSFGAASIPLNGTTSLTFLIANPNAAGLTGVGFTDTLPGGLAVATPNGVSNTCGGTVTATSGTGVVSLSGGSIAASTNCTLSLNVVGTAAGNQANTTGAITSTEGGTGSTSNTANINVETPPSIAKVFTPSTIAVAATTSLTFTITNPAANVNPLTGVAFNDTLPAGLTVANSTSTVCGGTLTTAAPTGISLTGATIAVNGQCQFSVTVTGATSGQYTNTTGAVTSTNGGSGNTASANLTVAAPPSITKVFGAAAIPQNTTTSLTFTVTNTNTSTPLTGVGFTDSLPAGLIVASTPNLTNTCGGTATATAGSGTVSLTGGTIAGNTSCTVAVTIQGTTAGVKNNTVSVTSTEGGNGNTSNASITVGQPPTISKAFGAASLPLNGSTSLTFSISNPSASVAATNVAFADTLPAGLAVSTPNGLTSAGCGTPTITATAGSNSISMTGGSIAASATCTVSLNITAVAGGIQNNTTGPVSSTEGGTGATSNTAQLHVVVPPSIAKSFTPSTISTGATTSLTFTITNPAVNADPLSGVAFTDTLPVGLTVASATSSVCGGTLTTTAPNSISLTGAAIAVSGQCQFSVTVTGATAGQYTNTTGPVTSTNGGSGNTASASLSVATPPAISKAFGAASILTGASTSLTFTISNPNTTLGLTGVAFTDALPAGLSASGAVTNTCGGTATGSAATVSLTGGTVPASGACTISLNVTGTQAGVQNNTTGPITSTESGAGTTSNTATITVIGPPSIAKAFGAGSISLGGTTTLSFTITNPNATVALNGVGFNDPLPSGLAVPTPNGLTGSCGAGTITTSSSSVTLTGGSIAAGGNCTFSINVTGTGTGTQVNTTSAVSSSNAGNGNTATATVVVQSADLTIAKTHAGNFQQGQTGATYTITVSNAGSVATTGTVTVTDTLPSGLTATALAGTGWTCTVGTLTCTRSDALPPSASYPPITLTVNVANNAPFAVTNSVTVSGGGDGNAANNTATDPTTINPLGPDVTIVKTHAGTFSQGQSGATYTMTVSNSGGSATSGTVTVNDTLPAGLTATAVSGSGWTCTVSPVVCTRSDALASGSSYPAITLTVNVAASAPASVTNTATVSGGGDANPANNSSSDVTPIGAAAVDLSIAKTHTGIFFSGQNGATYSITVTNSGAVPSSGTVTVTDTLPTGLTATAIAGSGWTCTLATLTCTRTDVVAAGASYPAITLTVNVATSAPASVTNTATVSGGGDTNPANNTASDVTPIGPSADIPTLSPELLLLLAAILGLLAFRTMKS